MLQLNFTRLLYISLVNKVKPAAETAEEKFVENGQLSLEWVLFFLLSYCKKLVSTISWITTSKMAPGYKMGTSLKDWSLRVMHIVLVT